jgi:hypothetical protein
MKLRGFIALVLGGLTIWAAITHPWVAPGFAALTETRVLLTLVARRRIVPANAAAVVLAQLSLGYLGVAYLMALVAGLPTTARFWIAFGASVAIFAPIVTVARRFLLRKVPGREA